jgi:hypothetical protein
VTLAAFLDRLDGVRPEGDQYVARCPAHQDRRPSLFVGEREGRLLVYDRAQHCRPEEIMGALGLGLRDLFTEARLRSSSSSSSPWSSSPLAEARRKILASARRQRWARPGVMERYRVADLIRECRELAVDIQNVATEIGDTKIGWLFATLGAELETDAHRLEASLG